MFALYVWIALQLRAGRRVRQCGLHLLALRVRSWLLLRNLSMTVASRLGTLERAIMDQLWNNSEPQTVRQIHRVLSAERTLAYSTVMTVLQRLAGKSLVTQIRDARAYQYTPQRGHEELLADLMVDALHQATDPGGRQAALLQFVTRVAAEDVETLRRALA